MLTGPARLRPHDGAKHDRTHDAAKGIAITR